MHHKDTKDTKDTKAEANELSYEVIGAAMEVHRALGPGLLESTYEECLARELRSRRISFQRQVHLPLTYKDSRLECSYRLDFVVGDRLILELKSVERFLPIHEAQVLTYLKLSGFWLALLMNFNARFLRHGIRRFVH